MAHDPHAVAPGRPGEFDLIADYFAPLASRPGAFGLLDDAACLPVRPGTDVVVTKDALAANVHFLETDPPDLIARKALRVNLSDLAAKGAEPFAYFLSIALPPDWAEAWIADFARGLREDQETYGVDLYGGDTLKSPGGLVVSITAIGHLPAGAMVTRLGGRSDDLLFVTGTIGDAALGLKVHAGAPEVAEWRLSPAEQAQLRDRYLLPQPRVALCEAVRSHASAAMDVSDGLLGDLGKLCRASGLGAVLKSDRVPLSAPVATAIQNGGAGLDLALDGGDDYEVLVAIPPDRRTGFEAAAAAVGISATEIGSLTKFAPGVSVIDAGGETVQMRSRSFEHF